MAPSSMPRPSINHSSKSRKSHSSGPQALSDETSCGCLPSLDPLPGLVARHLQRPPSAVRCTRCQTRTNTGIVELIHAVSSAEGTTRVELQHLAIAVFRAYGARPEGTPGSPWMNVLCELEWALYARRDEQPLANLMARLKQARGWGWEWAGDAARGIAFAALDDYEWKIAQGYVLDPRDDSNRAKLRPAGRGIGELQREAAHTETAEEVRDLLLFLRERCSEENNAGSWSPGRLDALFKMICPDESEGGDNVK
ncbi:hypothetical protein F4810DRAFT_676843 [Camillea tinctor]|nr:hypothetical protein F4810DRAFT_676843 [Camillea tinctor]